MLLTSPGARKPNITIQAKMKQVFPEADSVLLFRALELARGEGFDEVDEANDEKLFIRAVEIALKLVASLEGTDKKKSNKSRGNELFTQPSGETCRPSAPPSPVQSPVGSDSTSKMTGSLSAAAAPPDVDPEVFGALPANIQREILLAQGQNLVRQHAVKRQNLQQLRRQQQWTHQQRNISERAQANNRAQGIGAGGIRNHGASGLPQSHPLTDSVLANDGSVSSSKGMLVDDYLAFLKSNAGRSYDARQSRLFLMQPRLEQEGVIHCSLITTDGGKTFRFIINLGPRQGRGPMFLMSGKKESRLLSWGQSVIISSQNVVNCRRDSASYLGKVRWKSSSMVVVYDWGMAGKDTKTLGVSSETLLRREMACLLLGARCREDARGGFPVRIAGKHRLIALLPSVYELPGRNLLACNWRHRSDDCKMNKSYCKGEFFRNNVRRDVRTLSVFAGVLPNLTTYPHLTEGKKNANLSLVSQAGKTVLLVGGVQPGEASTLHVYVRHPLSLFQAFAIAISSYMTRK
jgi:hypothetical protein